MKKIKKKNMTKILKEGKFCFHLHKISRISKFIETESRLEISEGWEGEESGVGI